MLQAVWIQRDFDFIPLHDELPATGEPVDDSEKDRRTGRQWIDEAKAYLQFMEGKAERLNHDRWDPLRWWYLDGVRFLNDWGYGYNAEDELRHPHSKTVRITHRTMHDIRIASLASWPVSKLDDELMRLKPSTYTNRKLISHFTKVKLAEMVLKARAEQKAAALTANALERSA